MCEIKRCVFGVLVLILASCADKKSNKKSIELDVLEVKTDSITEETIEGESTDELENITPAQTPLNTYVYDPEILFEHNGTSEIGLINDPDGYSNLREEKNSKSKILTRIKDKEYFFYQPEAGSKWLKVKDLYGYVGYLHESRISKVNDSDLYNVSFLVYKKNSRPEYIKDTIVKIVDLDNFFLTNYSENDFNYREFASQKYNISYEDNHAIYTDTITGISVTFSKSIFVPKEHSIEYQSDGYPTKIDGDDYWGTDGGIPRHKLDSIVIQERDTRYLIPVSNFKNLFDPNLTPHQVNILKPNDDRLIIETHNSDGSGAYVAVFILKNNKLIKRIVYVPF